MVASGIIKKRYAWNLEQLNMGIAQHPIEEYGYAGKAKTQK
jgi:hypothetical protein